MDKTVRAVSLRFNVTEVRNGRGDLVGAVSPVAVPGVPAWAPLEPALTYVGWAHDWDADNPDGRYIPLCLGVNDDPEALIAEIEKRARDVQTVT